MPRACVRLFSRLYRSSKWAGSRRWGSVWTRPSNCSSCSSSCDLNWSAPPHRRGVGLELRQVRARQKHQEDLVLRRGWTCGRPVLSWSRRARRSRSPRKSLLAKEQPATQGELSAVQTGSVSVRHVWCQWWAPDSAPVSVSAPAPASAPVPAPVSAPAPAHKPARSWLYTMHRLSTMNLSSSGNFPTLTPEEKMTQDFTIIGLGYYRWIIGFGYYRCIIGFGYYMCIIGFT